MIELDPLQLSPLYYMDCLSYTKKAYPRRSNLAANGSYTFECAVWLNEILALLQKHPYDLKDTFDFVSKLSIINLSLTHMASFDVVSLFTNIPLNFAINLVLQKIYSDSGVALLLSFYKTQVKKFLIWTTKNTTSKFNDQYYKQVNRVKMGPLLSLLFADVCSNWIVDQTKKINSQPIQFYRYVDDCFALFSNQSDILNFHQQLYKIRSYMSIKNLLTKLQ